MDTCKRQVNTAFGLPYQLVLLYPLTRKYLATKIKKSPCRQGPATSVSILSRSGGRSLWPSQPIIILAYNKNGVSVDDTPTSTCWAIHQLDHAASAPPWSQLADNMRKQRSIWVVYYSSQLGCWCSYTAIIIVALDTIFIYKFAHLQGPPWRRMQRTHLLSSSKPLLPYFYH